MTSGTLRDWELEKAIRESLEERERFDSLSALQADVEGRLAERGRGGTTPERIRRLGIGKGLMALDIKYSRSGTPRARESCPVCGGKLAVVYNRTIDGDSVTVVGCSCGRCGYSAGSGFVRPARYIIRRLRLG